LFSISSITCLASIFLSVSELLQVLTINHPSLWMPKVDIFDYEILKSFHGLNDILIATLMAYYWDIERFKDVDSFIGYMVMGANPEVSGTSLNRMRTDEACFSFSPTKIAVHTSH
jgi:hypothetical protein